MNYKQSYIIAGTEIIFFVENKFKSQDDINHSREIRIAYSSLVVALIGLIFSFLSPFIFESKFDESQIKRIERALINKTDTAIKK
ncbi:hypothetical protein [uncultured Flavobacterium sp.]|uniref:hypothetical protein n=1 Tax=uncultured Flavobacterium sp. TaxID=165435 RepID=UPI00292F69CA|nr:hypothetical protein [uncultured Flavobacterium sp.]